MVFVFEMIKFKLYNPPVKVTYKYYFAITIPIIWLGDVL